jgi:hypothetical protein
MILNLEKDKQSTLHFKKKRVPALEIFSPAAVKHSEIQKLQPSAERTPGILPA